MSIWSIRLHLFCRADHQNAANAVAVAITDNPADAATFSVELEDTNGQTWYGCSTAATEAIRDAAYQAFGTGVVPSIRFFSLDAATEVLNTTNVPGAMTSIGQVYSWQDALTALGLSPVEVDPL